MKIPSKIKDNEAVQQTAAVGEALKWLGAQWSSTSDLLPLLRATRLSSNNLFRRFLLRSLRRELQRRRLLDSKAVPVEENSLWRAFIESPEANAVRKHFASFPPGLLVRMKYPQDSYQDPAKPGNLVVLKAGDRASGERGVLLVKYTEEIRKFAAVFDLGRISRDYQLVLEPSFWGYEDLTFLYYLGAGFQVLVQSPWRRDFAFVEQLGSNLVPTEIGAADWVDPSIFKPGDAHGPRSARPFDVVMVSSWHPFKRHKDLFRAVKPTEHQLGRRLRIVLVGYNAGRPRSWVEEQARAAGVLDRITLHEAIPYSKVAEIMKNSKVYALMSKGEGANKALFEAMAADTAVLYHARHRGVASHRLTASCGETFSGYSRVSHSLVKLLQGVDRYEPREWLLHHSGYRPSTQRLAEQLAKMASQSQKPWTKDLAEKKNAPNLHYAAEPSSALLEEYERLYDYRI